MTDLTIPNVLAWARRRATIACAYVLIGIATFGHAASAPRQCANKADQIVRCRSVQLALAGFGAGIFWPLYWSWEAQS